MELRRSLDRLPSRDVILAKARDENFPVASRLLPRRVRGHLLALYGFARMVDDAADEGGEHRPELLDAIEKDLDRVPSGEPEHTVMRRLAQTVRACDLPLASLRHLIEANRRDLVVSRYRTFDDLLAYCELSANPVGRLVLHVFGAATPDRIELSDRVCTALQLVEHLQDVKEDFERGRVYVPGEDLEAFGVAETELEADSASDELKQVVAYEAGRTRALLVAGAPLVRTLRGRLRWAVAGFVAGGDAALGAIERAGYDVLRSTPRATRASFARAFAVAIRGATR